MKNKIVTYRIFKGEDGFYVATNDDFGIYTQGRTFEELLKNVKEATEVSFDVTDSSALDSVLPPIMMNIDFSEVAYA